MHDGRANVPSPTIPGWRVILSDTGRFWASREAPFSGKSEWHAPPFRTADGDTFEELRAEVERQEEVARNLEAVSGETGGRVNR